MGKVRLNKKEMRALDKLIKELDDGARKGKQIVVRNDLKSISNIWSKTWAKNQD